MVVIGKDAFTIHSRKEQPVVAALPVKDAGGICTYSCGTVEEGRRRRKKEYSSFITIVKQLLIYL